MLSLKPNMWLREGGVSAHCEAGRRLFCCGPLRGGHFRIVLVYILVSVIYIFLILCRSWSLKRVYAYRGGRVDMTTLALSTHCAKTRLTPPIFCDRIRN